jgi:hypothetical protein
MTKSNFINILEPFVHLTDQVSFQIVIQIIFGI